MYVLFYELLSYQLNLIACPVFIINFKRLKLFIDKNTFISIEEYSDYIMCAKLKPVKVAYFGLDAAGKTTIIQFLEKRLTLGKSLAPTIQAKTSQQDVEIAGIELLNWDFGGQEQYREAYFLDPGRYFGGIDTLIFIIDIQKSDRFGEAINYLKEVFSISKMLSDEQDNPMNIFVYFHKFDYEADTSTLEKNSEDLKKRIKDLKIFKEIYFYKTSIFDDVSIIRAYSDVITKVSGKPQFIRNLLKDYCKQSGASTALLFDSRMFIVDVDSAEEAYVDKLQQMAQSLTLDFEVFATSSIIASDIIIKTKFIMPDGKEDDGVVYMKKMDMTPQLYLLMLVHDINIKDISERDLESLKGKIQELLKS